MTQFEPTSTSLWGAIEAGGTKFNCAVGTSADDIHASVRIPTTTPDETLHQVIAFFRAQPPINAVGCATFGPVDLDPRSPHYGYITSTPIPHWANTDLVGTLQRELGLAVGFDTDVNGAALGEHRWGAAQGLDTFVYFTIGTGVGGGGMIGGKLMHGLVHPEMGHLLLRRDPERDPFGGHCPFHGDCFEGLASGPALGARWGQSAETLPPDHEAWPLEADYIAQALANIICILSPQRIILGGGVMHQMALFPLIRQRTQLWLNGYVQAVAITQQIDQYIVPPALGDRAGIAGAFALAMMAHSPERQK